MLQEYASMFQRFGSGDRQEILDAPAVARRVHVSGTLGAWHCPQYGRVHPAKLARGLARVVERLGGRVYEGTGVRGVVPGSKPALRTDPGRLRARAIGLAGQACPDPF